MRISIIGSGNMAHGIGTRLAGGKHSLSFYDRDPDKARELAAKLGGDATGYELGDVIIGEVIIFALPYEAIFEVVTMYKNSIQERILVDISNPVDFQTFELLPPSDSSGAEEIAKQLSDNAKLVKAFNTTFAGTLVTGEINGLPLDVFVASDNQPAAEAIVQLANDSGLRGLYVGPLRRARALEGMQLIHMSLQEKLNTNWRSAIKILP